LAATSIHRDALEAVDVGRCVAGAFLGAYVEQNYHFVRELKGTRIYVQKDRS